jgi:hypothetical protein
MSSLRDLRAVEWQFFIARSRLSKSGPYEEDQSDFTIELMHAWNDEKSRLASDISRNLQLARIVSWSRGS